MAKESFDKEIQFLRMLVLTSGAYSRQQFADRLGISVHTYDKTLKRLKDIVATTQQALPEEQGKQLGDMLRYSYIDAADPMLLFLFRAKSIKETESERLSLLLAAMDAEPLTAGELLDFCCTHMPEELSLPDEKTIRNDLKYLEQVGVIRKAGAVRPYRYAVNNELLQSLTDEELLDLHDFAHVMANTRVPSIQGYLLQDGLKKHIARTMENSEALDAFVYKYHYYSRILDEAHLFSLLHAIQNRRKISFLYFSPKKPASYASKNTNPLFERDTAGQQVTTIPLQIVYDHQYGRWYLLGHQARFGLKKFRIEGMTEIAWEDGDTVDEAPFQEMMSELELRTRYSWLIDTGRTVTVRARFFNPGPGAPNFIKDRVLRQGQWGVITEENENSFIYEIKVNGTIEIKPWIRSFGSSCEVLEPLHLRKEMIQEWKELQRCYEPV